MGSPESSLCDCPGAHPPVFLEDLRFLEAGFPGDLSAPKAPRVSRRIPAVCADIPALAAGQEQRLGIWRHQPTPKAARCCGITEFLLPRGPAVQQEFILCTDLRPPRGLLCPSGLLCLGLPSLTWNRCSWNSVSFTTLPPSKDGRKGKQGEGAGEKEGLQ